MPSLSDKYVVFKREDWNMTPSPRPAPTPLADCFVLRSSDVLAAGALHGYAHLARTLLEMNETRDFLDPEEELHLERLADAVTDLAINWQRNAGRIPT